MVSNNEEFMMHQFTVPELRVVTFKGKPNPVHLIYRSESGGGVEIVMTDKAFVNLLEHGLNYVAEYNAGFDLVKEWRDLNKLKTNLSDE